MNTFTPAVHKHFVLECRRGPAVHYIPIPRPNQLGTDASHLGTTKAGNQAFVACPECGLVSAYSESDIQVLMSPRQDPFEAGECHLVFLEVECGDKNCETPAAVHTTIGSDKGNWKEKVVPRDWKFDSACLCENGHHLAPEWKDNRFAWTKRRLLF